MLLLTTLEDLLLQSSIDVEAMIRDDIAKVIATKLDNAAIYGSGSSNEPLGIKDTTGVGTQQLLHSVLLLSTSEWRQTLQQQTLM